MSGAYRSGTAILLQRKILTLSSRHSPPPTRRAEPAASRWLRWATSPWTAVALLALYYVNAVGATTGKCNTFDEIAHLTAGYTYWSTGEYRLQPENGNWPQRLA